MLMFIIIMLTAAVLILAFDLDRVYKNLNMERWRRMDTEQQLSLARKHHQLVKSQAPFVDYAGSISGTARSGHVAGTPAAHFPPFAE